MIPKAALWSRNINNICGDAVPKQKRPEIVLNILLSLMWNRSDIAHKNKITTWHQCSVIPKIHSNLCCPKAQTYATDTPDRANMDPSSNIPWPPLRSDLITAWSGDFDRRIPHPSFPPPTPGHRVHRARLLADGSGSYFWIPQLCSARPLLRRTPQELSVSRAHAYVCLSGRP